MITRVTIGRPAYRPADPRAEPAMMGLVSLLGTHGISWSGAWVFDDPDIAHAHNDLLAQFLAGDGERLLIIDTDILFRPRDALRLLLSDHDYVGANYRKKVRGDGMASMARAGGAVLGELVEAQVLATGFLSLSRHAVERLSSVSPAMLDGGMLARAPMAAGSGADGRWQGSDEALCRRWRALGEVAWIDTSVHLGHVGTHVYTEEDK